MITLKQIKPIFNYIKKSTRSILTNVLVTNKGIHCTDLETYILIKDKLGLDNGLHQVNTLGLVKGLDNIDDYPTYNFIIKEVESENLNLDLINLILPFASDDETRLNLCGVAFNKGYLVATDGHTLRSHEFAMKLDNSYIIPSASLKILCKLLKKYKINDSFNCKLNEEYMLIDNEYFSFKCKIIQREDPKWQCIVPAKFKHEIIISNWVDYKELKPLLDNYRNVSTIEIKKGEVVFKIKGVDNEYIIGNCGKNIEEG